MPVRLHFLIDLQNYKQECEDFFAEWGVLLFDHLRSIRSNNVCKRSLEVSSNGGMEGVDEPKRMERHGLQLVPYGHAVSIGMLMASLNFQGPTGR
eukprot:scaffold162940_cov19-Tisochrysis_lutea.AAC.2